MRVWSRIALVFVVLFSAVTLSADHYIAECPLSLVDSTPAVTDFALSPHGVFRYGSVVFALRGNILATYTTTDLGNLQVAREDYLGSLGARETEGGVAFANGYLYLSSEAGLKIYDLRNTRAGGTAPALLSRTPGYHYRRLAVNGTTLAGLYPSTDLPCYPDGGPLCASSIDIFDLTNLTAPNRIASISSPAHSSYRGFNDIAFNYGYLLAVSEEALVAFDMTNPAAPLRYATASYPGKWLVSNGTDFVGVGNDLTIEVFAVRPGMVPLLLRNKYLTAPLYLTIDRLNPIRFHRGAWWDESNARLVTMIEEVDALTLHPVRTVAFDVFDFTVVQLEGSVERIYEDVTFVAEDELKHDPVVVGPYVYVIGESTGLQTWGSCGQVTGRIELEGPQYLVCGGAEIHGWVTGKQKIVNVELFMNSTPLGAASLSGPARDDVSSTTPVNTWRINVNLDNTARGEYQLRAIGTDVFGTRKQFAMKRLYFQGPGRTARRRVGARCAEHLFFGFPARPAFGPAVFRFELKARGDRGARGT